MLIRIPLAALALCWLQVAVAAETDAATSGPYVTASVVESRMQLRGLGAQSSTDVPKFGDEESTGWSVGGGYRFLRFLGLEVGRMDLGEKTFVPENDFTVLISYSNTVMFSLVETRFESKGAYFALSGSIPIKDHWEPYAKLGAFRAETTATTRIRATRIFTPTPPPPTEYENSFSDNSTETMFALGVRYTLGNHYAIALEAMGIPDLGSEEVTDEGDLKSLSLGFQYRF